MIWTLQDAKNRFSALVEAALAREPQIVTRRGRPSVVVLSVSEYERLRTAARAERPSFTAHLLTIPPMEQAEDMAKAPPDHETEDNGHGQARSRASARPRDIAW